jgi:thiamine pyrophosphate-dependent acetolactate synthase large subunit-like protein
VVAHVGHAAPAYKDVDVNVAQAVGRALAELGVRRVFGVVGSGNFHVTNALIDAGARFVAARHEAGAATMADAYARISREVAAVSVHQGPGLTNAMTGVAEAAKSRTPLLVLAADTAGSAVRSNFRVNQDSLAAAVGAIAERTYSPASAIADVARAYQRAAVERRTVILSMPLDVQAAECPDPTVRPLPSVHRPSPAPSAVGEFTDLLTSARRPVFIAGRGARVAQARPQLEVLADRVGALLATSAVVRGMFNGNPWYLDVSGGFASPLAAELITGADLVVGWGCALNMWTMRHGTLIGPGARVVQVDIDPDALGANRRIDLGVLGDVARTAAAVEAGLAAAGYRADGYRSKPLAERIAREIRWRDVPYSDESDGARIDPRTLTIALDDMLPAERIVSIDSGNFMGYPSMYLAVPDDDGFCFTQAYQSIGLGLATAIGAALARPDRLPIAALGDGGALMSIAELDTAVRLGLPLVVVIYNDEAYGAEVHHFGPDNHPLSTVTFPETDIAAIGRGFGCAAMTVRKPADVHALTDWLDGPRDRPVVIDAKITSNRGSWWLEEAFRGH